MSLQLITAQTDWALELPEVKDHCRVDHTNDDAYLQELIYSVEDQLKMEYGIYLSQETYDLLLDEFPKEILIWAWPVSSITSVKYTDGDGDTQTVTSTNYATDLFSVPARIVGVDSYTWPIPRNSVNAVQVRFVTGFTSPAVVPADIKSAMYMIIKDRYDNREDKGRRFPRISERILTKYKYV